MDTQARITGFETRATTIGLTLHALCREAKVSYSSIYRWRHGIVSPTERASGDLLAKLEARLSAREMAVLKRLSPSLDPAKADARAA
jgi:hypothetical protein